jgi:Spy/CpxP family protein refolding chaperone
MRNKKTIAALTAVVVGFGSLALGANAWAKGKFMGGERMVNQVTKMLSLDEGQVESLKALQAEVQETRETMSGGDQDLMGAMTELLSAESFDQQRALDLINARVAALQANASDLVTAAAVFFDGLSDEQKAEITEKMEKMNERRSERGNRG